MNCVTYALGRVHRVGGYLLIRLSEHWGVPHMMHIEALTDIDDILGYDMTQGWPT